MLGDVAFEQFAAFAIVEVDDFDAVFAQPIQTAGKGAALADDQCSDAELPHQPAAIPARSERGDHDQVAIAALAAGAAKGVGLPVHAGVALLHAPVMAAAQQLAGAFEEGRSDRNAALGASQARFFKSHRQHFFVECRVSPQNASYVEDKPSRLRIAIAATSARAGRWRLALRADP